MKISQFYVQLDFVHSYSAKVDVSASGFSSLFVLFNSNFSCHCQCSSSVVTTSLYVFFSVVLNLCAYRRTRVMGQLAKYTNPSSLMMAGCNVYYTRWDCIRWSWFKHSEIPLENPVMDLFTDGLTLNDCRCAIWALCWWHAVITQGHFPDHLSSQLAEPTGCTTTIYTDSHTHYTCLICIWCFVSMWKWKHVKKHLAIVRVKTDGFPNTVDTWRNAFAQLKLNVGILPLCSHPTKHQT